MDQLQNEVAVLLEEHKKYRKAEYLEDLQDLELYMEYENCVNSYAWDEFAFIELKDYVDCYGIRFGQREDCEDCSDDLYRRCMMMHKRRGLRYEV